MFSKSQTVVTTLIGKNEGYILFESLLALSLLSFILLILIPHLSLNLKSLDQSNEEVEMMRCLHDYSYDRDDPAPLDGLYLIQSQSPHDMSIYKKDGQIVERIYVQTIH